MANPTPLPAPNEFSKVRGDLATFTCGRCREDKTSKNRYISSGRPGHSVTICNGCYGEIVAKSKS